MSGISAFLVTQREALSPGKTTVWEVLRPSDSQTPCITAIYLSCENWRFTIFQLEFWSEKWRFFVDVFMCLSVHNLQSTFCWLCFLVVLQIITIRFILTNDNSFKSTAKRLKSKVNDKIYFIYLIRKITMIGVNIYSGY
jgi:hypothetical protein